LANQRRRPEFSLAEVIDAVCRVYGITKQQLQSLGKIRPYTEGRALAALLVHESPRLSLTDLGKIAQSRYGPLGRAAQLLAGRIGGTPLLASRIVNLRQELGMAESLT
jgi:hypothetical protein